MIKANALRRNCAELVPAYFGLLRPTSAYFRPTFGLLRTAFLVRKLLWLL